MEVEPQPEADGVSMHQSVSYFAPRLKVPGSGPQAVAPKLPKTLTEWVAGDGKCQSLLWVAWEFPRPSWFASSRVHSTHGETRRSAWVA